MAKVIGTVQRHICGDCGHKLEEHDTGHGRCCMGYCSCRHTPAVVAADWPDTVTRPIFAAYDQATGRWG